MVERTIVFAVLAATLVLFVTGRWRYDVVALLALLAVTIAGIVPAADAFTGFGHPAVVTVAAILVVSRGLQNSGVVDLIARLLGACGRPAHRTARRPDGPGHGDLGVHGRTPRTLNLRWRYGVNVLAVARQGARVRERLRDVHFRAGDIVLLQGRTEAMPEVLATLGCLPLAERGLRIGAPQRVLLAVGIFGAALAAVALRLLPVQVAFVAAGVGMILAGLLSLRDAYESIDGPVIILLGAMIPVGRALEATGGAETIAGALLALAAQRPPVATLALVLVGTMFLSDIINNAAAAVLMAPIAINVAAGLGVSADPFLMAVAIGASCAFLTPIGHQSNTLVMGPGGYRFGDYWRLGLPLEAVIVAVALPLLLQFWPLVAVK